MKHRTESQQDRSSKGFSLVELMVVVAVIGILAGILIPGFAQGRAAANESAVIGTVRAISTGQFKFKAMALVDANNNGGFEYGTIREMTGGAVLRGSGGERLSPNLLPMSLDSLDADGRFMKHGYYFQLYLPDAAGIGLPETTAQVGNIDANNSQSYWSMLAWPVTSQSGRATYFVNQQGEVIKTTQGGYAGLTNPPAAGAGLVGTGDATRIDSTALAVNQVAADGFLWTSVR